MTGRLGPRHTLSRAASERILKAALRTNRSRLLVALDIAQAEDAAHRSQTTSSLSASGNAGNGACGSAWYQYAVEAMSSCRGR